jgi:hypothetical protein
MGLSDRPLSRFGNEVLLKAVIQAIPTYVMSCFQLPVGTCEEMRKIIANQWWGFKDGKRKMHWKSWDWLSSPKDLGGLGFRDMEIFNQAMLGRQCWRMITEPNSLCARVLKGRYFPNGDFWTALCPRSASYTWRSIIYGRSLLERGIIWRIGNGATIRIKQDRWIPGVSPTSLCTLVPLTDGQTVDSLLIEGGRSWDEPKVRSIFEEDVAEVVLQIPLSHQGGEDFLSWPHNRIGVYTVRSAYYFARSDATLISRSENGRGMSSDSASDENGWKAI